MEGTWAKSIEHLLRDFLTDGAGSPLYRDDPQVARRVAHEIATAFVVPATAHNATAYGSST